MDLAQRYYLRLAAAYLRGIRPEARDQYPGPLTSLTEAQLVSLFEWGQDQGIRLHRFKRTMGLPRVAKVLGWLQGLQPRNLLDIGTGRGVFLNPLLDAFPGLPVSCVDVLPHRVEALQAMSRGGLDQLEAHQLDAGQLTFTDNHFAVVTVLEVLEHLPNLEHAVEQICRVAAAYVILSVPSKEDDNPEHIHLLSPDQLRNLFSRYGFGRMKFEHVLNHRIALAQPG